MSEELASLKAELQRLKVLHQVSTVLHSTLDQQAALNLVVSEAVAAMKASSGSVILLNPNTGFLEIQASAGLPLNAASIKLRTGEGITGWVARTGKPARVGNVNHDRRYIMVRPGVTSELAVPLEVNGEIRGVLNVDADRPDAFSVADQELLADLALQVSKVIHNTWLYEQLKVKAQLFEALATVGQTINSTLNLDDALQVITREACLLMNAKMASLLMLDSSAEWLDLRASFGAGETYIKKPRLSVAESLLGIVVRRKKPLQQENVQISSRYQSVSVARREGLISLLSVPLVFSNQAIGALNVYTGAEHKFSNEEIKILSSLAELSALAIEKARLYEKIVDVEEQLRQSEKLSAIGLLAAEVAHEIRNPLTVMKMLYHSLDLRFAPDDPRHRDAEIVREKMDHLNKIVEQILDFARTTEPELVPLNVNQLIDDLALLVRHKMRNQGITFIRDLLPSLPDVCADATQLEQAFLNLTLNAIEAMKLGGKLSIKTRVVRKKGDNPDYVAIDFKDTGVGMNESQTTNAFSSLLNTTKAKGTGLGLAIVGRVVETHHGKLEVKSSPGRGTVITILLPF